MIAYLKNWQFTIQNIQFSHDHRFIAICIPTELSNGMIVKDMIKQTMTGFYIENIDNFFVFDHFYGLFYVAKDIDTQKGAKCMRADFDPNIEEDEEILNETRVNIGNYPVVKSEMIYEEPDKSYSVEVSSTLSGQYILIKSDNLSYDPKKIATEFRYRASNKKNGQFLIIQERKEGVNYDVKHQRDYFYILASTPEEYNGKVLKLMISPYSSYYPPLEAPKIAETTEIQGDFLGAITQVPHRENVYIEHLEAYEDFLVYILTDTDTSLQYIQVDNFSSGTTDIVSYDKYEGQLKVANNKSYRIKIASDCQNYYDSNLKYLLSTLHCPEQLINYELPTRTNTVLDLSYKISNVRIEDYTSERIVLPANDGVLIPVTLIYHKRSVKTGDMAVGIVQSYGGDIENNHNFQLDYSWYSMLDKGYI